MICFDREFPESARILMLKGAEIILVPNACPMEINRLSQLRARAYENMLGIATANYPGGFPDCNGHSSAFDGIAYRPSDSASRDTLIIEAGERPGIYMAPLTSCGNTAAARCTATPTAGRAGTACSFPSGGKPLLSGMITGISTPRRLALFTIRLTENRG